MYDSATPTALALRAYERAAATAQARRARLNMGYGLNEDGSMNSDTSGSIYQGNLGSVQTDYQAELADRRRGFGGEGGLAHKATAAAERAGTDRQSGMLRDAFGNIADTRREEVDAKGAYEDNLTQIRANADRDAAETLAANLVRQREAEAAEMARQQAASSAIPASAPGYYPAIMTPAQIAYRKKNPMATMGAR